MIDFANLAVGGYYYNIIFLILVVHIGEMLVGY
jgi:hypothetical protein